MPITPCPEALARALMLATLLCAGACSPHQVAGASADPVAQRPGSPGTAPRSAAGGGCLPGHDGYLRVRLRGAIHQDIDWRDGQLQCEGGPRPEHRGGRVAFAGPVQPDGHRLRFVFGLTGLTQGHSGNHLPTNVTVIVEGAQQIYSTRSDDKCSTDQLTQQPVTGSHRYRIIARGFCVEPASTTDDNSRLLVTRFDFAGSIVYEDNE